MSHCLTEVCLNIDIHCINEIHVYNNCTNNCKQLPNICNLCLRVFLLYIVYLFHAGVYKRSLLLFIDLFTGLWAGFRFWSGPGFRPDPSEYLYDVPHSLMLLNMQGRLGSLVFVIYHICYIPNIVSGCLALVGWAGWSAGQVGRHVKCRRRESNGR